MTTVELLGRLCSLLCSRASGSAVFATARMKAKSLEGGPGLCRGAEAQRRTKADTKGCGWRGLSRSLALSLSLATLCMLI